MASNIEPVEQTVSTALDGEPVDIEVLRRALGTSEGRDALVAFVLLRAAAAADAGAPLAQVPADVLGKIAGSRGNRFRVLLGSRVPAALAASIALLAVAGSFWLGAAWRPSNVEVQLAPPAAPAIHTTGVPSVTPSEGPAAPPAPPCSHDSDVQPPKPTRVLQYVRGVDWRDGT
jgi:hypothetical protein